jgi:outer membrane protein assembly factor BamD (BamD/ComL family)
MTRTFELRLCAALFLPAALCMLLDARPAAADWVWDTEVGWVDMNVAPAESAQERYAYARGLFVQGNYASAREVLEEVVRRFPDSPQVPHARFAEARCEAILGNAAAAGRIVAELLAERPEGIDLNELAAFQIELVDRIADPAESSRVLVAAAALAPSASLRAEAQLKLAREQYLMGRYDEAWESSEFARSEAPGPEIKTQALFLSALSDLAAARRDNGDIARVRRAQGRLRGLVSSTSEAAMLDRVQECLWLTESILNEPDLPRQSVYYDALRLYAPGADTLSCKSFRKAARRYKGAPAGETARFYQAECYFREERIWKAFKTYQAFVDEYPASRRMRAVIEREFAIGRSLEAQGSKRRAGDVMAAVAHNNPIGPLADDAYMALGRAALERERFAEARDLFDLVAREYPRSEWVNAAIYMGGVADFRNSDYANDRQALLERARGSFELYRRYAPDGPFAVDAASLIADCGEKLSRDMMETAGFYERRKQFASARVYYREVLKEYPDSTAAADAKVRIGPSAEEEAAP